MVLGLLRENVKRVVPSGLASDKQRANVTKCLDLQIEQGVMLVEAEWLCHCH